MILFCNFSMHLSKAIGNCHVIIKSCVMSEQHDSKTLMKISRNRVLIGLNCFCILAFTNFIMCPGATCISGWIYHPRKRTSNHTLNTYFSGMKIDPKYAFLACVFLNLSIISFPKFVNTTKNTPFFPNFTRFCTPKRCTRVHYLVLKNNPNHTIFFLQEWYPTSNTSGPQVMYRNLVR